ncbi:hypothetical protein JRO89_XS11G0161700 [Xanthoceras sorbifolium]|uniref:Cytochrome P450 n=1 Tax=Xanthoceras sorbifolium TaxID=99658 RepID=A0ABQ8HFU1_9ROSI|nr:hypothetical protein JRO89_XS11G0161700 [Xanthoceras sorbifolium]
MFLTVFKECHGVVHSMERVEAEWGLSLGKWGTNFLTWRRICPGIPLGEKMVLYVLASLLHSFDWKLPEGSQIDLTDKFGLALNKQEPLIAIPIAKLSSSQHYY